MKKIGSYILMVLGIVLGAFFIYKGINKHFLSPCKVYDETSTIPMVYQQVTTAFCQSGFFKVVGFFQISLGILLLFPRTRLLGAIMFLPVIANIFLIHYFLDNRPEELVETGTPLGIAIVLILADYRKWKGILKK